MEVDSQQQSLFSKQEVEEWNVLPNEIYLGDCLDIMESIKPGTVSLILTDLPYRQTDFTWDSLIPLDKLWKIWNRILTKNGSVVLTAKQPFTSKLVASNEERFKYELIWVKDTAADFMRARVKPIQLHENILVFSNGDVASNCKNPMIYNPQGVIKTHEVYKPFKRRKEKNVFNLGRPSMDKGGRIKHDKGFPKSLIFASKKKEKRYHPTQKPLALFEYLTKTYSNKGDVVLDCCAGSGVTAIACIRTNRDWILIEKDKDFYESAKERIGKERQLIIDGI